MKKMAKPTTSRLESINIKDVSAGNKANGFVKYSYWLNAKFVGHLVHLEQTECNYGGVRYWFTCPNCHRRVGVLYLSSGQCACRKCFNLAYKSERETNQDRLYRKAGKLRDRLGWRPGIVHPDGDKPKGMHWKTFRRIKFKHDVIANRICGATMEWINKRKAIYAHIKAGNPWV